MRHLFPEWLAENADTGYPFTRTATLTNGQRTVPRTLLLDAILYPPGGGARLYLAHVTITHTTVTVTIGDPITTALASGTFPLVNPPAEIPLTDPAGRPAGLLISTSARLSVFQAWGAGSWAFKPDQTEFCPTVCVPTPEVSVQGLLLPDGTVLTGDVWLVGADGIVLTPTTSTTPNGAGLPVTVPAIRVDMVGDPLFRRRLCSGTALFATPQFIKTIRVVGPNQTFDVSPDALGGFQLTANNAVANDTVLRVVTMPGGVAIHTVGSSVLDT